MNIKNMGEENILKLLNNGELSLKNLIEEISNTQNKLSEEIYVKSVHSKDNETKMIKYSEEEQKKRIETNNISQGDIWLVDFMSNVGSVTSGIRPAIVIGNNIANNKSSVLQVVPLTTKPMRLPTQVSIVPSDIHSENETELYGTTLGEQRCSVSISQLIRKVGKLKTRTRIKVLAADICSISPGFVTKEMLLHELVKNKVFSFENLENVTKELKKM